MAAWAYDAVGRIWDWRSLDDARAGLTALCRDLEFRFFTYLLVQPRSAGQNRVMVLSNYPPEWLDRYRAQNYLRVDPVIEHCLTSNLPYNWNRLSDIEAPGASRMRDEASTFGLCRGVSLGIRGVDGSNGSLHVSNDDRAPLSRARFEAVSLCLHAIMPYLHDRLSGLLPSEGLRAVRLTERETEVLRWVAEGKTSAEIGIILGVSEPTAIFHIRNAVRKLDASSRTHAVAKAMVMQLIVPENQLRHFHTC